MFRGAHSMFGGETLEAAALRFAAREEPVTLEEVATWHDIQHEQWPGTDLHWSDVKLLPEIVWSLQDADKWGRK